MGFFSTPKIFAPFEGDFHQNRSILKRNCYRNVDFERAAGEIFDIFTLRTWKMLPFLTILRKFYHFFRKYFEEHFWKIFQNGIFWKNSHFKWKKPGLSLIQKRSESLVLGFEKSEKKCQKIGKIPYKKAEFFLVKTPPGMCPIWPKLKRDTFLERFSPRKTPLF